jgi:hypothetical protein
MWIHNDGCCVTGNINRCNYANAMFLLYTDPPTDYSEMLFAPGLLADGCKGFSQRNEVEQ